jgi:RNA polymerase sigma-70 factor (ECF subfamily)
VSHGDGLIVLTLRDTKICAMTRFETGVLAHFGLPRSLRSE